MKDENGWYAFCFFFQAEDGIRDPLVTGVQTCALPISAEAAGQDGGVRMINSAIDDWCGNGRPPIPIPWPGPWPFAFALDAVPKDLDVATSRLVGALSFAAVAERMGKG